jgi:hypothetical protein
MKASTVMSKPFYWMVAFAVSIGLWVIGFDLLPYLKSFCSQLMEKIAQ